MKPLSFVIVGSGWRAMFYARAANRYPEQFRLLFMLCRSQEKAERIHGEYGIPTTTSTRVCEAAEPDFVVVAVSKPSISEVTKEWARKGFAVLCETPVGMNLEQLKELWTLVTQEKTRIQVAEQYIRYPILAAGLKALSDGKIGEPYALYLSAAHDYHGVSLIRHFLNPEPARSGNFIPDHLERQSDKRNRLQSLYNNRDLVTLCGQRYIYPVTETDSRFGPVTDGSVKERERTYILMEFASGKTAVYDFSGVQYHSYIRSRHLNVRGQDGEWNDTVLRYVNSRHLPVEERLRPYICPAYRALAEQIGMIPDTWSPFLTLDDWQDEYAVASVMLDMRTYLEEGTEVYPFAEALEDAYIWILMQDAVRNPGSRIIEQMMPWQKK